MISGLQAWMPLPALREDLRLMQGAPLIDGAPSWLLFDPVRHRYFQIGPDAFELLSLWGAGTVGGLRQSALARLNRVVEDADISALLQFLSGHTLLVEPLRGGSRTLVELSRRSEHGWIAWLIHNYLFIRIPLVHPQRFLDATSGVADVVCSRSFIAGVTFCGLAGAYGVSRQWEAFFSTFLHFISFEGALYYMLALAFVKTAHELGHAYAATRFGVKVPAMGIAFLVMMPVLYTDVTDAWRLRSRRQRLLIDAAGVIVECMLAASALFLWAFLPDGAMRSIAFTIATTSIAMSVAVNFNPFMRFDGYYILSDMIGVPNLQARAFALGRWGMREILFGLGQPAPETMSRAYRHSLILYAWGLWLYRFILFTGIAVLVYETFFKLLGIVLFAIEILWFVALPIVSEICAWWNMKSTILKGKRTPVSLGVLVVFLVVLAAPWNSVIEIPALLAAKREARIFAAASGQITDVSAHVGDIVKAGDVLLKLDSPEIRFEERRQALRMELLNERLDRLAADRQDRAEKLVIESQLASETEKLAGLRRQLADLEVRSPIDGVIAELDPALHAGRWLNSRSQLALIVDPASVEVRGYIRDVDVNRIQPSSEGWFVPDDAYRQPTRVSVVDIAYAASDEIAIPYLASTFGGRVAVTGEAMRKPKAAQASFLVTLSGESAPLSQAAPGIARIQGEAESLLTQIARQILKVLVRETGA